MDVPADSIEGISDGGNDLMALGYRSTTGMGRRVRHKTWFSVWICMKRISVKELARITLVGTATIERWRVGRPVSRHMAQLLKAFFPDIPIHTYGGPPARITEPLPTQSRSLEMYKYIFHLGGLIDDLADPAAIAKARSVGVEHDLRAWPKKNSVRPATPPPHR